MATSLSRELTYFSATALVVSNMIGTGIFTTTGFLASDLGSPVLVLAIWLVGGVLALGGCLAYSELGINLPRSGGEYVYLREAWGPTWGFMSGWVSFFAGFSAPIAAGALAIGFYLSSAFGWTGSWVAFSVPKTGPWFSISLGMGDLIGVSLILIFSVLNIWGLGLTSRIQNILTTLKVAIIVVFVLLAVGMGNGSWEHFTRTAERQSSVSLPGQFAVSLIFIMFAYSGWNAATYVTEELRDPVRTLPRVLLTGTLLTLFLYLALNLTFLYALPIREAQGVVKIGAAAATALFGTKLGAIFAGTIALGLVSLVSAMSIAGPRVYYAMAKDGCFPPLAARVHPQRQTPHISILFQAAAAILMVLLSTFELLIYYIGFSLMFFTALSAAGLIRLRTRPGWIRTRALNFLYPVIPVGFILITLWMLVYTFAGEPKAALWGTVTIATGGIVHFAGRLIRKQMKKKKDFPPTQ